ncbi:hypothetical protein K1719_004758 [Acacia pycnantha]|nr:hypothetical protein K1719_004758 [Acacia pycnantha]
MLSSEACPKLILDAIRFYYCDGSNKLQTVENCIEHQALGRCITSLCWRPDGKAIAVGLEDGTVSLHDVEVDSPYAEVEVMKMCMPLLSLRFWNHFKMTEGQAMQAGELIARLT